MGSRITFFEVEILDWRTKQQLCFLEKVEPHTTISDIQVMFHKMHPQWYPARQSIRLDPKGKSLKNEEILQLLPIGTTATLYFKDLGPQIGWTMVFLIEYTGPLLIYFVFYLRMPFIYGQDDRFTSGRHPVVNLACICHSFHYIKRLIETIFVHRFSHGTMPLRNIVKVALILPAFWKAFRTWICSKTWIVRARKNCFYYWGFAAWLAFYINHPLYTPPYYGQKQVNFALIIFLDPRPVRSLIQRRILSRGYFILCHAPIIPMRKENPSNTTKTILLLFCFCSLINRLGTWIGFTIMTQCVPVGLFALLCFVQMTVWAKDKHCTYIRQFKDYPSFRMSIIPFLL